MLSQELDSNLMDLAWSFWSELGVAGTYNKIQNILILPEELIFLTSVLADKDPRLLDEALDWCSKYHRFISVRRLQTLGKVFDDQTQGAFSIFSTTLNTHASTKWPIFKKVSGRKVGLSGKSKLSNFESPSMLYLRLRALFGVGARADLLTYCLMNEQKEYLISDLTEIGYSKRNLAEVMDDFVNAGIFSEIPVRNQKRYAFIKRVFFKELMCPLPLRYVSWQLFLEVFLALRYSILRIENKSDSVKAIEIRNLLIKLEDKLQRLNLTPPPMQSDLSAYWRSFADWILKITKGS
ncbi:MAG: hypothetical protein KBA81_03315 [Rhabdochlamydiaceae bacterium]|nr:hypothetical protein [Rhabdochlamydiaceae bacterium]